MSKKTDASVKAGISVIEILLVITLTAIIAAASRPLVANFLIRNQLHTKTDELVAALRTAQINSMSGKADSQWGLHVAGSEIVMFQGSSYSAPGISANHHYAIPSGISITNTDLYFDKLTGNPSTTASLTVADTVGNSYTVSVNQFGTVDVQ